MAQRNGMVYASVSQHTMRCTSGNQAGGADVRLDGQDFDPYRTPTASDEAKKVSPESLALFAKYNDGALPQATTNRLR
jgi:hypothetical protein